jgi:hypothetical protein
MKYALLVFGFVVAATPTAIRGVWDGQSLFGLILVIIAAGWILRSEAMDRGDNV